MQERWVRGIEHSATAIEPRKPSQIVLAPISVLCTKLPLRQFYETLRSDSTGTSERARANRRKPSTAWRVVHHHTFSSHPRIVAHPALSAQCSPGRMAFRRFYMMVGKPGKHTDVMVVRPWARPALQALPGVPTSYKTLQEHRGISSYYQPVGLIAYPMLQDTQRKRLVCDILGAKEKNIAASKWSLINVLSRLIRLLRLRHAPM
ncbi:hypothetical protein V8F20_007520 [Naviculisporaceae sp. PSN 640]